MKVDPDDDLENRAVAILRRADDGYPWDPRVETIDVDCDRCGAHCKRAQSTPTVHVFEDGHAEEVVMLCNECATTVLEMASGFRAQKPTPAQAAEIRRLAPPAVIEALDYVESHPDLQGGILEALAILNPHMRKGLMREFGLELPREGQ